MKFGKQIQKRQLDLPEYAASFLNYKALKKLIKQLSTTPVIPAQSTRPAEVIDPKVALRANKEVFFFRLEREIEKVNVFYLQKEAEFSLRLRTLLDKKRMIQGRSGNSSKASSTFVTLVEGFQQFDNDLNKLQQFVEVNETAISKILKKWDKTSKSKTKELYLQRAVELQPCFNRDVLRDLSDRATTARLDIEAWAEGENIQYDISRVQERQHPAPDENDIDLQITQAATSGNLSSLREWISRHQSAPDASARFTRVFLAVVSEAPDEALSVLLETNLIDLVAEDDINERNCLHKAAIAGRDPILQVALRGGVDPSRPDIYGRIPLHYACLKGRLQMAEALIAADPPTIDQLDHDNFTPLIHSITRRQIACVHLLLEHHARIDPISESDHTPLNLACQYGAAEIATLLLQRGAKLLPDAEGLYPQHLVARSNQSLQLLLILQSYGADLDQKDKLYQWTPLFHAASEGQVEGVRCLLDNGVDIDVLDEKNLSAMYYATWEGHLQCMKLLWDRSLSAKHARDPAKIAAATANIPPTSSFLMDTTPVQSLSEGDGIPDLSLPPPIIPLRRYGHNFLDTKTFISISFPQGTKSILFFNEGRYPAARMTISSKSSDLIPRNITLPMQEDSKLVSFQVDNLESFAVDFEIFPTFGSKIIAKSVALPDVFRAISASSGSCCLPLFDPRLRAIGQISLSFQVIKPYSGIPLEITHFATYWKATNADDAGHGGLITGSSLTGDYVQLFVQLTRDAVPVLFPRYTISHDSLEIPICQLTYQEFLQLGTEISGVSHAEKLRLLGLRTGDSLASLHTDLASSFLTLRDVLATLSTSIHVNITAIYPSAFEERTLGLQSTSDINTFVDAILNDVFEHTRASKEQNPDFMRSIVFTSYNSNICTALNWKQPNYPVLLCNDLGEERDLSISMQAVRSSGKTSISIKDAARLAQNNNFMGLICRSSILEMVPSLIETIKELGLVLVADTSDKPSTSTANPPGLDPGWSKIQDGINGVMKGNGVLRFNDTIDM